MPRSRVVAPDPPTRLGRHDGLAYALFSPPEPRGGVLLLHGAGSCKENHYDFARKLRGEGLAALAFDLRGHGDSDGPLGDQALADLEAMATLLPQGPLGLRGSSMGGYLALVGARALGARAIVAICPAGAEHLLRGLAAERLRFAAEPAALEAFLRAHDVLDAVRDYDAPLLLLHAEGDEQIPVEHSRLLLDAAASADKRLLAPPGGHHRSLQHDAELQAYCARFLARALAA